MRHATAFLLLAGLTCGNCLAQHPTFSGKNLPDHMLNKIMDEELHGAAEVAVEGSPYLHEDFVEAEVFVNTEKYSVPVRYNIFADQVEFKQKGKTYLLDPEPRLRKLEMGNATLVVARTGDIGKMKNSFFLRLDSGKVDLLKKKVIQFREAQAPKALESSSTPAKYLELPDRYYIRFGDGELVQISGNIKKVVALFPDKQTELEAYRNSEGLSARDENDLLKLVRYYNSL